MHTRARPWPCSDALAHLRRPIVRKSGSHGGRGAGRQQFPDFGGRARTGRPVGVRERGQAHAGCRGSCLQFVRIGSSHTLAAGRDLELCMASCSGYSSISHRMCGLCMAAAMQIFESRLPLQRVTLQNKAGKTVLVDRLPAQCVQSSSEGRGLAAASTALLRCVAQASVSVTLPM